MKYVFLTDNIVTDQTQINPFDVFNEYYATQFIEAPDEVTFGWRYNGEIFLPPPQPTPEEIQNENKSIAVSLLSDTDWSATVDINNPQYSNPYLMNQDAFLSYRSQVRQIAVNPPITPATFPDQPQAIWSNV